MDTHKGLHVLFFLDITLGNIVQPLESKIAQNVLLNVLSKLLLPSGLLITARSLKKLYKWKNSEDRSQSISLAARDEFAV